MAAFPVLELNHPTLLNLIAIGCYTIAMLFHVISFTTDNWSYMRLEGIPWKMGLWRGCKQHADKSWNCTSAVFDDKVFQTGMSSDWYSGTQVMMTLALIALFLLEFAIICYVCIKRMEVHRDRVTGVVLGLSLTAGSFMVAGALIFRNGGQIPNSSDYGVGWSLQLDIVSGVITWVTGIAICGDRVRVKRGQQQS